jgi:hypothetical protein
MSDKDQHPTTPASLHSKNTISDTFTTAMPEKPITTTSTPSVSIHGQLDPGLPQASNEPVNALPFKELIIVFVGLVLGVFLAALDQTIVSVCTTKIANEFKALNDVAWIGT